MLSSGSCPVLALWGTNSKLPGPSRPLYPANRCLTHGHFSVIFCHPKSFLKHVPRITVGEGSVGFPPNGCVARRPLRAGGKLSCPSRHPRGRTHRQVALPGPRQVRGARKVHEWESHGPSPRVPGSSRLARFRVSPDQLRARVRTTGLPPQPVGRDALGDRGASVPRAHRPGLTRDPGRPPPSTHRARSFP